MPIHNWACVHDGMFHWFHQLWVVSISHWLNAGRLPEGLYAIGELYADGYNPDVLAVEDRPSENGQRVTSSIHGFGVAIAEKQPKTRFSWDAETEGYQAKKDLIAIRNVDGILVAVIEIVSPGNKSSKLRFGKFVQKTIDFIEQGVHVLVIDLFPHTSRDPLGIHQAIWSEFAGEFEFQPDKPLTLASYMAADEESCAKAYVEPIALGEALPMMPLFLWTGRYINVDLEATYNGAWDGYPAPLKPKIEGEPGASAP